MVDLYKYIDVINYAAKCHIGQIRKYSNIPYIVHPIRVSYLVQNVVNNICLEDTQLEYDMIVVSLLHDVVEDCDISLNEIKSLYNTRITNMIRDLTHESVFDKELAKKNRATRLAADLEKLGSASLETRIIKACDRIDNLKDIPLNDGFMKKYKEESEALFAKISHGFPKVLIENYENIMQTI